MKALRLLMIALSVASAHLFIAPGPEAGAQTVACKVPALHPRHFAWKTGVTVQVNIDPAFTTQQQRDAVAAAFTNWNNAKTGYCPDIKFGTPTFSATPIAGRDIAADPNVPKLQVYRLDPPEHPGDRGGVLGKDNGSYTLSAWIYINPLVTVPEALTQVTAHEIGHTMGLAECTNCGGKTSVMHDPAPSYNDTTGLPGPTTCDIAAGKQVMGCPYDGSVGYFQQLTIYKSSGGTERWDYRFGYGLSIKQTGPGTVSISLGWRQSGYAPYPYMYPPASCNVSTSNMTSQGAKITFTRNGKVFDTANNTLTTTYLQLYGHDYKGTYSGNMTDLGNEAQVSVYASVTTSGCQSQTFTLSPSGAGLTLK